MINCTKHLLKSNMVLTTLGADHCDLHILEHPSQDKQTELEETNHTGVVKTEASDDSMYTLPSEDQQTEWEETKHRIVVKTEGSDDSMSVDGDIEVKCEADDNYFSLDPLKYESPPLQCTLCFEEFFHEHEYMRHMSVNLQNGEGDGECDSSQVCKPNTAVSSSSSHSSLITENKQADSSPSARAAHTAVAPPPASLVTSNKIKVPPTEEVDTEISCRYNKLTDCFIKLYDIFAKKVVLRQDGSLLETEGYVL